MADVFVDTVAWIALVNVSEALHDVALTVMQQLQSEQAHLVTTDMVVT